MNTVLKYAALSITALAIAGAATTIQAQTKDTAPTTQPLQMSIDDTQATHHFTKKRYSIKGMWSVAQEDGQDVIRFNEDFKTKGGPDLKVYLSSNSLDNLDSGAVEASSVKLSVLKSNRGAQSYVIPADIDLIEYKSVVIHCEAFSVLWGGFDL